MAKPFTNEEQLRIIAMETLGVDDEELTSSSHLIDDVGLDSLDQVELVMAIEEKFGIEISDDDVSEFRTWGEVVAYVDRKVGAKAVAKAAEKVP